MTHTILVVDDDPSLRETLQTVLTEAGYQVIAVSTAEAGLEAFVQAEASGAAPSGMIIDLLLPKMSGFDLAKRLRQQGAKCQLVMMSGVFKTAQHKEEAQKLGAGFLQKPFSNDALLRAFESIRPEPQVRHDVPKMPLPAEGTLLEAPVLHLLWRASREGHTGILDVFGDKQLRGRVFVFKGRATMAQHSEPSLNVGVELIRQGVITAEMYQQAVQACIERGQGLHDVIKAERWADEATFREAYRAVAPNVIAKLAAASGRFRWTDGDAFSNLVPAAPVDIMPALFAGLRMSGAAELAPHVDPRAPLRIAPGDNWDEALRNLEQACGSASLVRAINGRATIAQLVSAARDEEDRAQRMRQVYLLISTQSVRASLEPIRMEAPAEPVPAPTPQPAPAAQPRPAPAAAAAPRPSPAAAARAQTLQQASDDDQDRDLVFSAEEKAARERVAAKFDEINGKKLWEVLGLSQEQSADPGTLKKAYFALAREWHTDTFAGLNLGAAHRKLDHVFSMISQAYNTLSDPSLRGDYEATVRAEDEGMSGDLAALLEAEQDFTKGKVLLERGEVLAAAKLFERAAEAHAGNKEWDAYRAYSSWWAARNPTQADGVMSVLDKAAKELPPTHVAVADLLYFQGRIAMEVGQVGKADRLFRKCLQARPDHVMCNRDRRALQRKIEEEEKKKSGGLGRFLKR